MVFASPGRCLVVLQNVDRWGNVVSITDPRSTAWKTTYRYNADNQVVEQVQTTSDGVEGLNPDGSYKRTPRSRASTTTRSAARWPCAVPTAMSAPRCGMRAATWCGSCRPQSHPRQGGEFFHSHQAMFSGDAATNQLMAPDGYWRP